jgi:hypothetical protein
MSKKCSIPNLPSKKPGIISGKNRSNNLTKTGTSKTTRPSK